MREQIQSETGREEAPMRSERLAPVFSLERSDLFLRPGVSVLTEITDGLDARPRSGWVFYDGECALCLGIAGRFGGLLGRAGFELVAFQNPWGVAKLGLAPGEVPDAARVRTADGAIFEGADAMVFLAGRVWWAKPFRWLGRWPVAMGWMRRGYTWFGARRHCIGGACGLQLPVQRSTGASIAKHTREKQ